MRWCPALIVFGVVLVQARDLPAQTWARSYGGGGGSEVGQSIQPTPDGGFIAAGYTSSAGQGNHDIWIQKLNAWGFVQWERTYGGPQADRAESVHYLADPNGDGYLVAGYTFSFSSDPNQSNIIVLRLDLSGNVVWERTYGGPSDEVARSFARTSDGNFVMAGYTKSCCAGQADMWVIKIDPDDGTPVYQVAFGGPFDDSIEAVAPADPTPGGAGGCIVAGYTRSFGANPPNIWVLRLNTLGGIVWQEVLAGNGTDIAYGVRQIGQEYLVAASSNSSSTSFDVHIIRLDSAGHKTSGWSFGTSSDDEPRSLDLTPDSGQVIAGYTESGHGQDLWLLKIDATGSATGQRFDSPGNQRPTMVRETPDGSVMIGFSEATGDSLVLRANEAGIVEGPCPNITAVNPTAGVSAIAGIADPNTSADPGAAWVPQDPNGLVVLGISLPRADLCTELPGEVSPSQPRIVGIPVEPFTINTFGIGPLPCGDPPMPGCWCCQYEPLEESGSTECELLTAPLSTMIFTVEQSGIQTNSARCCDPGLTPGQGVAHLIRGVNMTGCGAASDRTVIAPSCP